MNKHKVTLNHLPQENIRILSSASSVLKSYLTFHSLNTTVIYWNLQLAELQRSFVWNKHLGVSDDSENFLLLFFNYLAIKNNDWKASVNVKARLMSMKPSHVTSEIVFFEKHMKLYAQKLDEVIDKYIEDAFSDETLCFMFLIDNKYDWICASIIAEKIKQKYIDSIIVIGGIDEKDIAEGYLLNFSQFDFAIWGEVELTMLRLCNYLIEGNETYEDLSRLVFRQNDNVVTSAGQEEGCIPLSDEALRPDYSDFFEQRINIEICSDDLPVLNVEINRGHKYKPAHIVKDEISHLINQYQINTFYFSGSEVLIEDSAEFDQLLDVLIQVKEQYPDLSISLTPVQAAAITPAMMRKMMMAGFYSIRTDYVSASENLLKKCESKSSFADHLLLMKFASLYNIVLAEITTFTGMSGEEDEDILQAISNLYYLRFYFSNGLLRHRLKSISTLYGNQYCRFLPSDFLKAEIKSLNIASTQMNPMWEDFRGSELYFIQNKFEYKLYRKSEGSVLYRELFNNNVINEFDLDVVDWFVLESTNFQVVHIGILLNEIKEKFKKEFMEVEVINLLENLKTERLIYISTDYSEIVSVINTKLLI